MFSQSSFLSLALSLLLKGASAAPYPAGSELFRRWDTSVCTAETSGVPIPDSDNFQLPLEDYRQDMCWGLCVGGQTACPVKSQVCYNFVGTNLIFDYKAVPGYTYTGADIWLGLSAPADGSPPASQYTSSNGYCTVATDRSTVHCSIPYSKITSSQNVLSGMCPNGDREGLIFYLYTNAQLKDAAGKAETGTGRLSCSDYPTCSSYRSNTYWELAYRCTNCPVVSSSASPSSTPTSSTSTSEAPASSAASSSAAAPIGSSSPSAYSASASSSAPGSSAPASSAPPASSAAPVPASSTSTSSSSSSTSSMSSSASSAPPAYSTPASSAAPASSSSTSTSSMLSSTMSSSTTPSSTPSSSTTSTSSTSTSSKSFSSTPSSTPGTQYCSYGTAFGYSSANPQSLTLNSFTPQPNTCNRWGWYSTPTTAQLSSGIGGPLYVGAGRNDISKATNVGTWSATLSKSGVSVTYSLSGAYSLAEVHVDIGCLPLTTCAPGQYTYVNEALTKSPPTTSFTTAALTLPSCSAGNLYLIVHASVNTSASGATCPAPVAT